MYINTYCWVLYDDLVYCNSGKLIYYGGSIGSNSIHKGPQTNEVILAEYSIWYTVKCTKVFLYIKCFTNVSCYKIFIQHLLCGKIWVIQWFQKQNKTKKKSVHKEVAIIEQKQSLLVSQVICINIRLQVWISFLF